MAQLNHKFRFTIQSCVAAALLAVQAPTVSAVAADQVLRGAELATAIARLAAVPAAYVQPTDENKPTLAKFKVLADAVRVASNALMFFNHVDESTAPLYNGLWASVDTGFLVKHICDVFDPEVEPVSLPQDVVLDQETNTTVETILTKVKPALPAIECLLAGWVAALGIQNDPLTTALRVRLQSCLSLTRTLEVWSDNCHEPNKRYYFALVVAHVVITLWELFRTIQIPLTIEDRVTLKRQVRDFFDGNVLNDAKKRIELLQEAADQGDAEAMGLLGECLDSGKGISRDKKRAVELYQKAADLGDVNAMYQLDFRLRGRYDNQKGREYKYFDQVFAAYQPAAARGDKLAMKCLADYYLHGIGLEADKNRVRAVLQQRVDAGDVVAMCELARCVNNPAAHRVGLGPERNSQESVQLNQRAAALGSNTAKRWLADHYSWNNDDGDQKRSLELSQQAIDNGDEIEMFNLAWHWKARKDVKQAFELFQRAADRGNTRAMYQLAQCYAQGQGVEKDEKRAIALFQQAADQFDPNACKELYNRYLHGNGVEKDEARAIELLQQAARVDGNLRFELGMRYIEGRGLAKDEERGLEWIRDAAKDRNYDAIGYLRGRGEDTDIYEREYD